MRKVEIYHDKEWLRQKQKLMELQIQWLEKQLEQEEKE